MGREHEQDGIARSATASPTPAVGCGTRSRPVQVDLVAQAAVVDEARQAAGHADEELMARGGRAPRTDSLGTSYTAKIRLLEGAFGEPSAARAPRSSRACVSS